MAGPVPRPEEGRRKVEERDCRFLTDMFGSLLLSFMLIPVIISFDCVFPHHLHLHHLKEDSDSTACNAWSPFLPQTTSRFPPFLCSSACHAPPTPLRLPPPLLSRRLTTTAVETLLLLPCLLLLEQQQQQQQQQP
jgi:hypothetical protein